MSPIFKKGDAANLDNYRAIAVGSVLGKLYAVILDTRLFVCAEKNGWRAEGQAGFRAGKSTVDHVFVLRHLIESTQKSRKVLYCCFVDFRKAFDRVRRDYLIQRRDYLRRRDAETQRLPDFWALSATGCVPLSALVKYVAVCVRVCWYCHQSGGTDVVDFPDILLPAGQYLDLFDSESETDVPSDSSDEELVEV